ncbi:Transposase IS200 like, partial [Paracoccus saliphilus]
MRLRARGICRQVYRENEVHILREVLSSDHVHMFVLVPPKLAISDLAGAVAECVVGTGFPLSPETSGHAFNLGLAECVETVHEGDAELASTSAVRRSGSREAILSPKNLRP